MAAIDWGLVILGLSILAFVLGGFAKMRVVGLLVGIVVVSAAGGGGHLMPWAAAIIGWLNNVVGAVTTWAVGVAAPGLLAILIAAKIAWDLHPRHGAKRSTFILMGVLAVMIAASATSVGVLNNLGPQINQGVTQTTSGLGG